MFSRSGLLSAVAIALMLSVSIVACVGGNVTLGTAADDPEVPHRAPSAVPRAAAVPTSTPTPTGVPPVPAATPVPAASPVPSGAPVLPASEAPVAAVPAASSSPSLAAPASPESPFVRLLGDPVTLAAEPCASKGIRVRAVVPRPADLDPSYRGAVAGIEIRRTVQSGTGGFRHATLTGGVFEADLWARGAGLSAGALGKETCTGGAAARVSFEVVAHYRR